MTQIYKDKVAQRTYEIMQLCRKDRSPFPYTGCRFILQGIEDEFEDFIPDLNTWSMYITGLASQSYTIKQWPEEKIRMAQGFMSLSFFDKHPEYQVLERFITAEETPDLYECLKLHEEIRKKVRELIASLLHCKD